MFLTRLVLNGRSRQVQRDLANPWELHRTLMAAFPDDAGERPRDDNSSIGLLYRVELPDEGDRPMILVQSRIHPQWQSLPAGYLAGGAVNPALKEFVPSFSPGQMLVFRLHANPTTRLGHSAGERKGKRVGVRPAELEQWLQRKAEAAGLRVHSVNVANRGQQTGRVPVDGEKRTARWLGVRFDGACEVVDPDLLLHALESGIGSGKAFGFGLLSLARTR